MASPYRVPRLEKTPHRRRRRAKGESCRTRHSAGHVWSWHGGGTLVVQEIAFIDKPVLPERGAWLAASFQNVAITDPAPTAGNDPADYVEGSSEGPTLINLRMIDCTTFDGGKNVVPDYRICTLSSSTPGPLACGTATSCRWQGVLFTAAQG
jgi:hypothetical protein